MTEFDPFDQPEASQNGHVSEPIGADDSLPPDIEAVWGRGRRDANGALAADTARYLIGEWGLERFRRSALHRTALGEEQRAAMKAASDPKPESKGKR